MAHPGSTGLAAVMVAGALAATPALGQSPSPNSPPRTTPGQAAPSALTFSDATVEKTGAAVRSVAGIRQRYAEQIQAAQAPEQRRGLEEQAANETLQAIDAEGLTVAEYNGVLRAAQNDPQLRERLIAAAQLPRR